MECPQPTTCVPDTIPGVVLNTIVRLMRDENTLVSNTSGVPFPDPPIDVGDSAGILVSFRIGYRWFQFLDLFSGTQVGNWNTFFESEIFQNVDLPGPEHPQYFSHNLVDLGEALTAIADRHYRQDLSAAVPYMISTRQKRHLQSDQSAEDEPLASFSRHRLRIGWVRVLP